MHAASIVHPPRLRGQVQHHDGAPTHSLQTAFVAPLSRKRAHVTFAHLPIANLPACAVAVSPSGLRRVRVGRRHLLDQGGHAQRRARKLPQFAGAGADGSVPGHWAIKGGDATQGALKVYWDGKRAAGYAPMKKQGAIILGIGGDNSDGAVGTFYEGAMTAV